jgi:hypothetical protein
MEILQVTLLILLINAVTFLQCCLLVRGKPAVCRRKPPIISTLPGNGNPLVVVTQLPDGSVHIKENPFKW